jgi:hypothetical protein
MPVGGAAAAASLSMRQNLNARCAVTSGSKKYLNSVKDAQFKNLIYI